MNLTEKELENINIIKERWEDYKRKFCESCMKMYVHCGVRNLDAACGRDDSSNDESVTNSEDSTEHPDRADGDILAYSAYDIWTLLNIIDRLKNDI